MGVKHFWPWLRRTYGSHIRTISRSRDNSADLDVDILAIDMNGIIHNCTQKVFRYGNFAPRYKRLLQRKSRPSNHQQNRKVFEAVAFSVEYYRKMVNPKKKLLLCVDGVAGTQ